MEVLKNGTIIPVKNGKFRVERQTETGELECTFFVKDKEGKYEKACEAIYSLHSLELISRDYDGKIHQYTYEGPADPVQPKRFVSFGMYWQEYGRQTVELPPHIDPDDRDAVIGYIRSVWDDIPLPEGSYVSGSDEMDPESEIQIVRF